MDLIPEWKTSQRRIDVGHRTPLRSYPVEGIQAERTSTRTCDCNGNEKEGQRKLHPHRPAVDRPEKKCVPGLSFESCYKLVDTGHHGGDAQEYPRHKHDAANEFGIG